MFYGHSNTYYEWPKLYNNVYLQGLGGVVTGRPARRHHRREAAGAG